MPTSQEKFLKLLREDILKLDLAELDFGIYRILNYRRDEIDRFLGEELPVLVAEAIGEHGQTRIDELRAQLEGKRKNLEEIAKKSDLDGAFKDGALRDELVRLPAGKQYLQLEEELQYLEAEAGFTQSEQEHLYNHLYTFFSRYYRDGDFHTQMRRSRKATFAVPYHGQDVHFYWKSYGSHYVKTAEELKSYVFRDPSGWRLRLELVGADVEQDNVKGPTRYFLPLVEQAHRDEEARTFILPFTFRPLTEQEADAYSATGKRIQDQILANALDPLITKLPEGHDLETAHYHMRRYVQKHRSDYLVHPRLGDFLREELDYYLKNEFLQTDALTSAEALRDRFIKFETLRDVGHAIIDLLDQVESFQARLFEKRKFVLDASYLIPLRLLDRELWSEVVQNEDQVAAWRQLFALEGKVTEATLETHPTLVLDTRHFDSAFTLRALAAFDDLDEATDGVLIHAENYAALRTLQPKYQGSVKVIYIDPPYNTGSDEFLYKDEFSRHSTWLTMMAERLRLGRELLAEDGVIFVSIDDNEQARLKHLMDNLFGDESFAALIIARLNPRGRTLDRYVAKTHEYISVFARTTHPDAIFEIAKGEEALAQYNKQDELGSFRELELRNRNPMFNRQNRPNLYYPFYVNALTEEVALSQDAPSSLVEVWPLNSKGEEGCWTWGPQKAAQNVDLLVGRQVRTGAWRVYRKDYIPEEGATTKSKSIWLERSINNEKGKEELGNLFSKAPFDFPKSVDLIEKCLLLGTGKSSEAYAMDFFAGSGTTGHAVINLNRQDGGRRKFILVEMAEYFDTVVLPRVHKVMYAPDWKDGKPMEEPVVEIRNGEAILPQWAQRSPRLVKVLRLESYEDSLNALELPEEREQRLQGQRGLFTDELRYLFNAIADESPVLLNTEKLERPFHYKLRVHTPQGECALPVNLVETANLLLGLHVKRLHELHERERRYVVVEAREGDEDVLVIWRDIQDPDPLDPADERAFLQKHFDLGNYAAVYANADSAISKGEKVLDIELRKRMLEPDPGVVL